MSVFNLLSKALGIIPPTTVQYHSCTGQQINSFGISVPVYDEPVTVREALVQGLNNRMYADYGLSLEKEYKMLHIKADIEGVNRKTSGDKVVYGGRSYTVIAVANHFEYDGWDRLILAEENTNV